jgi:hypothetical protein
MTYQLAVIVSKHSHIDNLGAAGIRADFERRGTDLIRAEGLDAFDARIDTFCLDLAGEHSCRYTRRGTLLVFYDGFAENRAIELAGGAP